MVINQYLRTIQGRKAIVLFTDGVDTTSRRANYQSTVREAEEADALIYPLRYDTYADMNAGGTAADMGRKREYTRRYFWRDHHGRQCQNWRRRTTTGNRDEPRRI